MRVFSKSLKGENPTLNLDGTIPWTKVSGGMKSESWENHAVPVFISLFCFGSIQM